MKVKELKKALKNYNDDDNVFLYLGPMTSYRVDTGKIEPLNYNNNEWLYRIVKTEKDNDALVLLIE